MPSLVICYRIHEHEARVTGLRWKVVNTSTQSYRAIRLTEYTACSVNRNMYFSGAREGFKISSWTTTQWEHQAGSGIESG
jgi:hypothetical protein